MPYRLIFSILLIFIHGANYSQNLPSLLLNKNINSTFSILAYDSTAREWGIAVATNNIYVGNSTIYIQPGIGAFSVIAETEPSYAIDGFEGLKKGKSIQEAIEFTKRKDNGWYDRQVAGIDAQGNTSAFTGEALKYWQGKSDHIIGNHFVVMGNQLADQVLYRMKASYESSSGTLAERLLKSLLAGQSAGGQINGKQSAALVVKGIGKEWYNQIDLRVDNSVSPFEELQKLLNYHYGRITLNQAIYALKAKNISRGKELLVQAEEKLKDWNGIYSKIAMAYILLGDEKKAVFIIRKAMSENSAWKHNLPAFYCLNNHPEINNLLNESTFTLKDWYSAIRFLINIDRNQKAIDLANKILKRYPSSSFVYYLRAKAYAGEKNTKPALNDVRMALQLDQNNAEAKALLGELER